MQPTFWKLSQGTNLFNFSEIIQSIENRLVYMHKDTQAKGISGISQGQLFIEAAIGDYFYLTHGNNGIYLLGQFTGPVNYFSEYGNGWLDRPFRIIKRSNETSCYEDKEKWWTPNHNSTFVRVPNDELDLFEELILEPFFEITLKEFGL